MVTEAEENLSKSESKQKRKKNKNIDKLLLLRLFRFGIILFTVSITNSLIWVVIPIIFENGDISIAYSMTSPLQYAVNLIFAVFSSGACIKKEREQNKNAIGSGFVYGVVITFALFLTLSIFADNYINFYGYDPELYRPFVIYCFAMFFVQNAFNMLMQKLYYEDNEKKATIFYLIFYISNFVLIVLLSLITKDFLLSTIVTLALLSAFVGILAYFILGKFRFEFSFLSNIKYTSASVVSSIFMFCIYFFGIQTVFSMGNDYVVAMNFADICMRTPWNCLNAVATAAQVDISKKRLRYKSSVKVAYIYAALLLVICFVMFFGFFNVYGVSLQIALIYLAFHLYDYISWTLLNILAAVTQLDFSPVVNTCLDMSTKVARLLVCLFFASPYVTSIGAVVNAVIAMAGYLFIRYRYYKVVDGVLIRKEKLKIC